MIINNNRIGNNIAIESKYHDPSDSIPLIDKDRIEDWRWIIPTSKIECTEDPLITRTPKLIDDKDKDNKISNNNNK